MTARHTLLFTPLFITVLISGSALAEPSDGTAANLSALASSDGPTLVSIGQAAPKAERQVSATMLQQSPSVSVQQLQQALAQQQPLPQGATISHGGELRQLRQQRLQAAPRLFSPEATTADGASPMAYYHEFGFYDANSYLFEDWDYDGFYQSFSVSFDADLLNGGPFDSALVYAELYLSRNGGPWEHYYSTDFFTITGASGADSYEVHTVLAQGYRTDHYDVLIDLYEVGFGDVVATISSYDTNALYALPLESRDYDDYQDSISHGHSGSSSWVMLGLLLMAGLWRKVFAA